MDTAWLPTFAIVTIIVAAASALQAATGMGMALVAAPLLTLVDPTLAPGPALCAVIALSAAVAWRDRVAIDRGTLGMALAGLVAGSLIGAAILVWSHGVSLARRLRGRILVAVLLSISGIHVRAGRLTLLLGGAAAGVLGTMAGVHGPPIALLALQHEPLDRLRATLKCAFFTVGGVVSLMALAGIGNFGTAQIAAGAALLPGVAIGFAVAPILGRRIDRRRDRIAVLAVSTLSALALLLH